MWAQQALLDRSEARLRPVVGAVHRVTPAFMAQGRIWWWMGISSTSSLMRTSASRIMALRLATSVSVFMASTSLSTTGSLTREKLKLPSAPEVRVRTNDCSEYCAS